MRQSKGKETSLMDLLVFRQVTIFYGVDMVTLTITVQPCVETAPT
jgi:hypothetical protein